MKRVVAVWIASVSVVGMISCSKEPAPAAPAAPAEPARAVSVGDQPGEAPPPPPAAAPEAPPSEPAPGQADQAAAIRMLTKGLKDFVSAKGKLPNNLDEVKAAGFIQTIPDPPTGMRWDFDRKKVEVIVAGYAVGL